MNYIYVLFRRLCLYPIYIYCLGDLVYELYIYIVQGTLFMNFIYCSGDPCYELYIYCLGDPVYVLYIYIVQGTLFMKIYIYCSGDPVYELYARRAVRGIYKLRNQNTGKQLSRQCFYFLQCEQKSSSPTPYFLFSLNSFLQS